MILKRLKIETNWKDETNCYVVVDEITKEAMVVDPAGDSKLIEEMLDTVGGNLKYIVLTHCHGDHVGAAKELREHKGGRILIHALDAEGLNNPEINMTDLIGMNLDYIDVDSRLHGDDLIHLGDIEFKVIYTPGHTKGRNLFVLC